MYAELKKMESSANKPSDVIENAGLSNSVQNVINRLSKKGKVNAKDIVDELLSDHTGYARAKFPPDTISSGYNKTILGVCAIERDLGKQLLEDDFLDTIVGEVESQIKESFTSLLTNKGQKLWLELKRSNTYILKQFADLMEPNPCAMKRFANSYGVQMAMDIMRGAAWKLKNWPSGQSFFCDGLF